MRIEQEIAEYYQQMQSGAQVDVREATGELQMLYEQASRLRPVRRSPAADQFFALTAAAAGFLAARMLLYVRERRKRHGHTD